MESAAQAGHIRLLVDPRASLAAFARQRRRFASAVEDLSSEELASPSRCAEWTVADVLRHVVWVDLTARRIWSGDQSMAEGFDPRATPHEAVRESRAVPDEEIRERFLLSTATTATLLESSDEEQYGRPSLSPAGRVPWWMSAVHMGWDSSIHERDALLPLGQGVEPPASETRLYLAYSLVLASFFAGRDPLAVRLGELELCRDAGPVVVETVAASDEEERTTKTPATVTTDDPVGVIDAMAGRGPIEESLKGDSLIVHRLGGLARYFTSPAPGASSP